MNRLKVPQILSGTGVKGNQGIAEQVGSLADTPIEVSRDRTRGHVQYSARFIQGHACPVVGAPQLQVGLGIRPAVISRFPGVGDGVEDPLPLAGNHVIGPDVSGRRVCRFSHPGSDDEQVLMDDARRRIGHKGIEITRFAIQVPQQIDVSIDAKGANGFAAVRVYRIDSAACIVKYPFVLSGFAFPVADSPVNLVKAHGVLCFRILFLGGIEDPFLLSRVRLQGDQFQAGRGAIKDTVPDDGIALVLGAIQTVPVA